MEWNVQNVEEKKKFSGIEFFEIDVDNSDGLAEKYFISSVPTMIIFKSGEEFDKISGAVPYDRLESFLNGCLWIMWIGFYDG